MRCIFWIMLARLRCGPSGPSKRYSVSRNSFTCFKMSGALGSFLAPLAASSFCLSATILASSSSSNLMRALLRSMELSKLFLRMFSVEILALAAASSLTSGVLTSLGASAAFLAASSRALTSCAIFSRLVSIAFTEFRSRSTSWRLLLKVLSVLLSASSSGVSGMPFNMKEYLPSGRASSVRGEISTTWLSRTRISGPKVGA